MKNEWMEGWENSVKIRDPSHINLADGTKLYNHWRKRQREKKPAVLKFVKAVESDKRRKLDEKPQKKRKRSRKEDGDSTEDDDSEDEETEEEKESKEEKVNKEEKDGEKGHDR